MNKNGVFYQPAFKGNTADITAAGDIIVGSYSSSLLAGRNPTEGRVYASAASANSLARLGAQSSIPIHEELTNFIGSQAIQRKKQFQYNIRRCSAKPVGCIKI